MINCQFNAVKQCKLLKIVLCSGTTSNHFLKLVTRWSWSSCYNSPLIQIFPISYKNLETPQNVATQFRFLRETPPIAMMSIPETIMLSKGYNSEVFVWGAGDYDICLINGFLCRVAGNNWISLILWISLLLQVCFRINIIRFDLGNATDCLHRNCPKLKLSFVFDHSHGSSTL